MVTLGAGSVPRLLQVESQGTAALLGSTLGWLGSAAGSSGSLSQRVDGSDGAAVFVTCTALSPCSGNARAVKSCSLRAESAGLGGSCSWTREQLILRHLEHGISDPRALRVGHLRFAVYEQKRDVLVGECVIPLLQAVGAAAAVPFVAQLARFGVAAGTLEGNILVPTC